MKKIWIFFVLILGLFMAGCFSPAGFEVSSADEDAPLVGLYRLRALDPLMITLLGIPQEKQMDVVIDEHGNITMPYVKDTIPAVGLTTSELEREIQRIYTDGQIYRNITVNVQAHAKIYYVEGEIKRPQEYELNRRITLLQAIAASGGYTEYANQTKVTITRNGRVATYNAKKLEKYPELDVPVEAGDRIKVHRSFF